MMARAWAARSSFVMGGTLYVRWASCLLVPAHGQRMGFFKELLELVARLFSRVDDGDPTLGGIHRVRDQYVGQRVIELVVMGLMLSRRVAQEPLEPAPANG